MKRIIILVLLTYYGYAAQAQNEQSLNFVQDIWQANLTNPALMPKEKTHIMLPSIYFNLRSPNFTLNNLVSENSDGETSVNSLIKNYIKPENRINGNIDIQTLGTTFNIRNKVTIGIYHAAKMSPNFSLSDDLINLLVDGNSAYIGKTAQVNSDVNASLHSELALGATFRANEKVTIGVRAKYLSGIAGAFTASNQLNFSIDNANYAMSFDNNLDVRAFSINKLDDIVNTGDILKKGLFSSNNGVAFDLGTSIKLGKWQINASVIDLGASIKWKNDGKSYQTIGKYTYTGANVNNFFSIDSLSSASWTDTLKKVIGYKELNSAEYTQRFPTKIYLSGTYKLTEKLRLGALIYSQLGADLDATGVMLDATYDCLKLLSIGTTVGLRDGSFGNLGAHLVLKLGPVRIYGVTDNILSAFRPYDTNSSNGRLGINLAF